MRHLSAVSGITEPLLPAGTAGILTPDMAPRFADHTGIDALLLSLVNTSVARSESAATRSSVY
jgi:hypothetical protein